MRFTILAVLALVLLAGDAFGACGGGGSRRMARQQARMGGGCGGSSMSMTMTMRGAGMGMGGACGAAMQTHGGTMQMRFVPAPVRGGMQMRSGSGCASGSCGTK